MAGLFGLIWAMAVGASATKHAMTNSWCKNNQKHTLSNGMEYYIDADGKYRLLDGTQIMWLNYGEREKIIEVKTSKVVYDRGAEIDRERERKETIEKQKSAENGMLLYAKVNPRCGSMPVAFEHKTNKQLARIATIKYLDTKEIEYRKWYFYDYVKESLPPGANLRCLEYADKTSRYSINFEDKGILITKEEYDKIFKETTKLGASIDTKWEKKYRSLERKEN